MKKTLVLALAALAFVACKKDDKTQDKPKTNKELIIGTWTSTVIEAYTYNETAKDTTNYISIPGPLFTYTFKSDGTLSGTAFGSTSTGTYSIDGDLITIIEDGDTTAGELTTLTASKLVIESDDAYTDSNATYHDHQYLEFHK